MNQFPPQPQSIPWRPFQIFSKIRGDIRKSRCTTGVNDTSGKINCHRYQRHRRQIFPRFFLALLIPVANNGNNYQTADNLKWTWTCDYLREFSKKIRNGPISISRGLEETDSWKKPEAKISGHYPFKGLCRKLSPLVHKHCSTSILSAFTHRVR